MPLARSCPPSRRGPVRQYGPPHGTITPAGCSDAIAYLTYLLSYSGGMVLLRGKSRHRGFTVLQSKYHSYVVQLVSVIPRKVVDDRLIPQRDDPPANQRFKLTLRFESAASVTPFRSLCVQGPLAKYNLVLPPILSVTLRGGAPEVFRDLHPFLKGTNEHASWQFLRKSSQCLSCHALRRCSPSAKVASVLPGSIPRTPSRAHW